MNKPTVLFTLAGDNSRFHPFNTGSHKSGVSLLGKPLVVRTMAEFIKRGYTSFVIVVSPRNHQGDSIREMLSSNFPTQTFTFVEQPEAKGMGDAVLVARQHLGEGCIYASGYHQQSAEIADQFLEFPTSNVVCSAATEHPWDYGILTINGDRAVGVTEKPAPGTEASNQKIQTIYRLDGEFLERLAQSDPNDHYNFETVLNEMMEENKVGHLGLSKCVASLKFPWQLFDIQAELFEQLESHRDPTARISPTAILDESDGPIWIGEGVVIRDFAKIAGPAYIGNQTLIGDYAFVRQSSVEEHSQIGSKTELVRSIIMSNSSLHFSYVADSIIGHDVQIGAGLITANKRLDRKQLQVDVKGKPASSGRANLGVMIGDQANLGIGVKTMPGVIIGAHATIFPSVTLFKHVPAGETIKPA